MGRATDSVDPALLARVEAILEARNVDGKVPWEIARRILDDMAVVTERMESWSCSTYQRYGMHDQCRNEPHAPSSDRRSA